MARQKPAAMVKKQLDPTERKKRAKKAKETREARKYVESRAGKAANARVGNTWSGPIGGKMHRFVVKKVKDKKRWVKVVQRRRKVKQESCPQGQYLRKGFCVKKPVRKMVVSGPCPKDKVKSAKTGRCINRRRQPTAKGKTAMETRKAREYVETRAGKASNARVGNMWSGVFNGKKYKFVVRKVKGKKRWVRVVRRAKPQKKRTQKATGELRVKLPQVKKTSIDPLFAGLGDLPGTYAELRM